MRVENETGKEIATKTLTGDVFQGIAVGGKKVIKWDLKADEVVIKDKIRIAIFARLQVPDNMVANNSQNAVTNSTATNNSNNSGNAQNNAGTETNNTGNTTKTGTETNNTGNTTNTGTENNQNANSNNTNQQIKVKSIFGSLVLSTFWPGAGTSRYGSNANALWGVLGYGCLGGAAYFGYSGLMNYDNYLTATESSDRNTYYATVQENLHMVQNLAIGAAAIWGLEYIRVIAKGSKAKRNAKKQLSGNLSSELSFVPAYNPYTNGLQAGLKIRF